MSADYPLLFDCRPSLIPLIQGICPGNRLRLLAGVYDSGQKTSEELSNSHGQRRSWQSQSSKVSFVELSLFILHNLILLHVRRNA